MKHGNRTWMYVLTIVLALVVINYFLIDAHKLFVWFKREAETMRVTVQDQYTYAVCVYLASMIISTCVFIPVTAMLTVIGGYLFGFLYGGIYAIVGATVGSMILFLFVRYAAGKYVQKQYANQLITLNEKIKQFGASYLLIAQLMPATPTWLINIGAGLMPISLFTFTWTTCLGILPGSFMYAYAGQRLYEIEAVSDIMTRDIALLFSALALLAAAPIILKYIKRT